jgi:hypothetical protein
LDNAEYNPKFVPYVMRSDALHDDPFVLLDVGCGMGLDPLWRFFEPHLVAHGFDPQIDEVERLNRVEKNPAVHYHASLVGLPQDDSFHQRRRLTGGEASYYEPARRSSGFAAVERETQRGRDSLVELNSWHEHALATEKASISNFVRGEELKTVDFVKIDTDGGDFEVVLSAADVIDEAEILGFMVETPYNSAPDEQANAFHTIDLYLKNRGFLLYTMSVNRYSRSVLPARFVYRMMAQTISGQVIWGDLTYLRDGGSPNYIDVWKRELTPTKLLKLACLYELFQLPDCAIELLLLHEEGLKDSIDVRHALDLLTPPLDGQEVSYDEYVAAFEQDPYSFYPQDANALVTVKRVAAEGVGGRLREVFERIKSPDGR